MPISTDLCALTRRPGFIPAVLFAVFLWLYTLENQFPFHHHPDEPAKTRQVLRKDWNFHHPVLMVWSTERILKLLRELTDLERNAQTAVIVGRTLVAAFMAGAVAIISLLMVHAHGRVAGGVAGLIIGLNPALFHIAHSFKEDPLLVFGWCIAAAACALAYRTDTRRSWLLFGGACALAASGKYVGIIAFFVALGMVLFRRRHVSDTPHLAVFLAGFFVLLVVLNLPMFSRMGDFLAGFTREVTLVREGHHGVARTDVPHALYLRFLWKDTPLWLWPLVLLFLSKNLVTRSLRWTAAEFFLLVVLSIYLAGISCSPKIIYRYAFPLQFFLGTAAVLAAIVVLPRILRERCNLLSANAAAIALGIFLITWHLTGFGQNPMKGLLPLLQAYRLDYYGDMIAWINDNLPPDATIYQPEMYHLPDDRIYVFRHIPPGFPQKVVSDRRLFDQGGLGPLREAGITHVIIPKGRHRRYADSDVRARDAVMEQRNKRAATYEALYAEGKLLYERDRGILSSQHIGVEIYDISP